MPEMTFPVVPDGLLVRVLVGLDGNAVTALHKQGQPIPPPLQCLAVVDTGADVSCIARRVVEHFDLQPIGSVCTHTTAGTTRRQQFSVSLGLVGPADQLWLASTQLDVVELTNELPNIEVLLGLDVLLLGCLLLDGPNRTFTFAFPDE